MEKSLYDEIRQDFDIEKDFTCDLEKARAELNSSDPIATILRGHLYKEHTLDEMLKMELKRPDLIDLASINFSLKPKLCVALGIMSQRTSNLCLKINKVRNKLAYYLDNDINKAILDDLLEEYEPDFRQSFIDHVEKETGKTFESINPTNRIAKLVRDVFGTLQGMRRAYEIHLQKRDVSFKVVRNFIENCECQKNSNHKKHDN